MISNFCCKKEKKKLELYLKYDQLCASFPKKLLFNRNSEDFFDFLNKYPLISISHNAFLLRENNEISIQHSIEGSKKKLKNHLTRCNLFKFFIIKYILYKPN